jgi:hypothetical protein
MLGPLENGRSLGGVELGIRVATFRPGHEAVPHVAQAQVLGLLDLRRESAEISRHSPGGFVVAQLEPGMELALEPMEDDLGVSDLFTQARDLDGHGDLQVDLVGAVHRPIAVSEYRRQCFGIAEPTRHVDSVVGELLAFGPGPVEMAPLGQPAQDEGARAPVAGGQLGESRLEECPRLFIGLGPGREDAAVSESCLGEEVGTATPLGDLECVEKSVVGLAVAPGLHTSLADGHEKLTLLDHIGGPVRRHEFEGATKVVGRRLVGHLLQGVVSGQAEVAQRVVDAACARAQVVVMGQLVGVTAHVWPEMGLERLPQLPVEAGAPTEAELVVQSLTHHGMGEAMRVELARALGDDAGQSRFVERKEKRLLVAIDGITDGSDVELVTKCRGSGQHSHTHRRELA